MDSGVIIGVVTRSLPRVAVVLSAVLATAVGLVPAQAATGGGFTVTPNITDPICNSGQGVQLPTNAFKSSSIASGQMDDGTTLTAFGQIYPGQAYVVLDAVDATCSPDAQFGDNGTTRITVPNGLIPAPGGRRLTFGFWILGITPSSNGGALLAGVYRNRWVVASVQQNGELDSTFGANGWVAPPMHGEATQIVQEPSGQIIVAGDNEGGGCCTVNHAVALTQEGRVDASFGKNGSITLPTGTDSGVRSLSPLANGNILAQVEYGNSGCWGIQLAMFTPAGKRVAGFAQGQDSFWRTHNFGAFVGDAYVDGDGFTLVGTGQRPCANGPKVSAKSAHGVIAHFTANGTIVGHATNFPSKLSFGISAFKHGDDTLLYEGSFGDASSELLRLIGSDGSALTSYGTNGVVRVTPPSPGSQSQVFPTGPTSLAVVATEDGKAQFSVTRLDV
mgnify:FL=1